MRPHWQPKSCPPSAGVRQDRMAWTARRCEGNRRAPNLRAYAGQWRRKTSAREGTQELRVAPSWLGLDAAVVAARAPAPPRRKGASAVQRPIQRRERGLGFGFADGGEVRVNDGGVERLEKSPRVTSRHSTTKSPRVTSRHSTIYRHGSMGRGTVPPFLRALRRNALDPGRPGI